MKTATMYDSLADKYEKMLTRYVVLIKRRLLQRVGRARDKTQIARDVTDEFAHMDKLLVAGPKAQELINDFTQMFNRGDAFEHIITSLKERFGINTEPFKDFIENEKELPIYYPTDEAKRVAEMASDERKLLKFLVEYSAIKQTRAILPDLLKSDKQSNMKPVELYPVHWTTSRDNKNEFVQLIYGLHQAGYLNNGQGEITKIVESLAEALKVNLGKSWQSNLSSSIHKSKKDYEPPIFQKIRQAYLRYAEELITAKKTNR